MSTTATVDPAYADTHEHAVTPDPSAPRTERVPVVPPLFRQDRDLLAIWAEHGIPDDQSTRDAAIGVMWRLWESHEELDALVGELLALAPDRPVEVDQETLPGLAS